MVHDPDDEYLEEPEEVEYVMDDWPMQVCMKIAWRFWIRCLSDIHVSNRQVPVCQWTSRFFDALITCSSGPGAPLLPGDMQPHIL